MAARSPRTAQLRSAGAAIQRSPRTKALRKAIDAINAGPTAVVPAAKPPVPVQRRRQGGPDGVPAAGQTQAPNRTGLPDGLKAGIESLSGQSLDHVRVHRNSARPAQLHAHAYAQGSDIHLAPGQEKHLPHEAWHVVQQAQGRVRPTLQLKEGVPINDDPGLEREADVMGAKAIQRQAAQTAHERRPAPSGGRKSAPAAATAQRAQTGPRRPRLPDRLPRVGADQGEPASGPADLHGIPIQRLITAAAFRLLTPGSFFRPRKAVATIDAALNVYHASPQATKLANLDLLIAAIQAYIAGKANDLTNNRLPPAQALLVNAFTERVTVYRLDVLNGLGVFGTLPQMGTLAALSVPRLTACATIARLNTVTALEALAADVGDGAELEALLTAASGAGTPGQRLRRVLDANPLVPRTHAALGAIITAQKDIDEKILRGRINGGVLGAVGVPNAGHRTLIGGHSQGIRNDPAYVVSNTVANPNGTQYVSFRKLIRQDATGFAAAVHAGGPGSIVTAILAETAVAANIHAHPPALILPVGMPAHVQAARINAQNVALGNMVGPLAAVGAASAAAIAAAPAATAALHNATAQAPFIDALTDLNREAVALLQAGVAAENNTPPPRLAAAALVRLQALILNFQTTGPVLSMNKNSTFAPLGWTDDQVLAAGDLTAATPATLIRFNPPANNPADGDIVDSKHERIVGGMVWVVMKDNVTYHTPPPTLTGGTVISSYPTNLTAIPANPALGHQDADRFGPLH